MDKTPIKPSLWLFALLVAFFVMGKLFIAATLPERTLRASDLTTSNIAEGVNKQRALRNLTTLNTNEKLTAAAEYKSDDMQSRHYFAHVDPDGHYIWDKIVALGYTPYLQLGENLAINFYDTESLISAWMNSPEHRANILNDGFRDQGMGLNLGDVAQNQYYSSIANTFGAQAAAAKPAVKPAVTPVSVPATKPAPPAVKSNTTPPPAASVPTTTPPQSQPITTPVAIRTGPIISSPPATGFALPQQVATSTPSTTTLTLPPGGQSASGLVGNLNQTVITSSQLNRNLILACGIALLLLMLYDIKKAVENKLGSLDKKTNNFVLLLITIIVVAFMYWF